MLILGSMVNVRAAGNRGNNSAAVAYSRQHYWFSIKSNSGLSGYR